MSELSERILNYEKKTVCVCVYVDRVFFCLSACGFKIDFHFLNIREKYYQGKKFGRKILLAKNYVHDLIGGEMWFIAIFIF